MVKWFKLKCFFTLGALVFIGAGVGLWGLQKQGDRTPASFENVIEFPEIGLYERQESVYLEFSEESNFCMDREPLTIVLEAINVAVLSESEPQIQIHITSNCERDFDNPIFFNNFCEQGLMYEDYDGVLYKMINGMGFFPKEWKFKKIVIGDSTLNLKNQLELSEYIFSCL